MEMLNLHSTVYGESGAWAGAWQAKGLLGTAVAFWGPSATGSKRHGMSDKKVEISQVEFISFPTISRHV